ncbi:hypothetical protein [Streptomyces sp. NRRL S-1521]|nr:hypothetical protein [Streptomyces sp. NRRL S-1521]
MAFEVVVPAPEEPVGKVPDSLDAPEPFSASLIELLVGPRLLA